MLAVGSCNHESPAVFLFAVILSLVSAIVGETLADLECGAKLVTGGCRGIDLGQQIVLREPFDEVPEFCRPDCVSDASSGVCDGSKVGGAITSACGLIDCLKPVFEVCKAWPCSPGCQERLEAPACNPFENQLSSYGIDTDKLGPNSPTCLGNRCASKINRGCAEDVCAEECGNALSSPECSASPDKVPGNLQQFVDGASSKACLARNCSTLLVAACGDLAKSTTAVTEIPEAACSQECADAFATEACLASNYTNSATLFGPSGTVCTERACLENIVEACGINDFNALDFSVRKGSLPKLCSEDCKNKVKDPKCNTVAEGLLELVGPNSAPCVKAECLLSTAHACNFEPADDLQNYLNLYPATQICSSNTCSTAIASSGCVLSGVHGNFMSFCDCIPRLLEECGIDLSGPPQPWNEVVSHTAFCSLDCKTLLSNAQSGCATFLPVALQDNHDFLCSCGAEMVGQCNVLTGNEPFSKSCCQIALSNTCFMKDSVQAILSNDARQLLLSKLPKDFLSEVRNATQLQNSVSYELFPDDGMIEVVRANAEFQGSSFYGDFANVISICLQQGFEPRIDIPPHTKEGFSERSQQYSAADEFKLGCSFTALFVAACAALVLLPLNVLLEA